MRHTYIVILIASIVTSCNSKNPSAGSNNANRDGLSHEMPKEYPNSIYIGRVTGQIADSLETNDYLKQRDSIFNLNNITKSNSKIEIRFFTTNYWSDTSYCIILKYDSSFSLRALKHYYIYDTVTNKVENRKHVTINIDVQSKADSIFDKLVENGVFSINMSPSKINYSQYPLLELTRDGFKEGSTIGDVLDGVDFQLEYKVDRYYDRIYINNPSTYFRHNPDFQKDRRKYEVTKLMLSGLK
jgi:hypothetical protein